MDGVKIIDLTVICDERGRILHMLRCDAPHFENFGEIYFSTVYQGAVKAWHLHKRMTSNYAVVRGMIKLVLNDDRKRSKTKGEMMEILLGESNYKLVVIPPMVWNGFKGIGNGETIVANCSTIPHDPDEIMRKDPQSKDIPYDWEIKHK